MLTSYLCSLLLSQSLLLVFYSSYLLISLFGEQPKKKGTTRKILIVLIIIVIITCTSIWAKKLGAITLTGLASCGIISSIIHFQFGFGFHLFFFLWPHSENHVISNTILFLPFNDLLKYFLAPSQMTQILCQVK